MILTITRDQGSKGMVNQNVAFNLTAKIELTEEEKFTIDKYKLGDLVVYNSETAKEQDEKIASAFGIWTKFARIVMNLLTNFVRMIVADTSALRLTINNLTIGKTVNSIDLEEMIHAEECIHEACELMKQYVAVAQSYDGSQQTFEF